MKKNKSTKSKYRKVKLDISVELETLLTEGGDEQTQLNNIAKVYSSCFGGKDIEIKNIQFLD